VGGDQFGISHIEGSTQNAGLAWQYAQLRSQAESLFWTFGVNYQNAKSLIGAGASNAIENTTTNILLLQAGVLFNRQYQDASYYTLGGNLWTNGKSNSGQPGDNDSKEKLRVELDGSYVKPFADVWEFIGQGTVLYSPDPLVDGDKYSLGGPGNVRGFQSADARGDRGLFGSVELQRDFFLGTAAPIAWGVFLDSGHVWTLEVPPLPGAKGATVDASSEALTSIGTEFQLLPTASGWSARLQFAWAIGKNRPTDDVSVDDRKGLKPTDVVNHDRGPHIWLTVGTTF
jgi:hemolysin activation/secretion protein